MAAKWISLRTLSQKVNLAKKINFKTDLSKQFPNSKAQQIRDSTDINMMALDKRLHIHSEHNGNTEKYLRVTIWIYLFSSCGW